MTRSEIKELDMKETFRKEFRERERRSALKRETEKQTTGQSVCGGFERVGHQISDGSIVSILKIIILTQKRTAGIGFM
jgi:hypothetical protein